MKSIEYLSLLCLLAVLLGAVGCRAKEVEVTREIEKEVEVTRVVTERETVVETVVEQETVVQEVEVTREAEVEVGVPVELEPAVAVPFADQWASSGHADAEARAFAYFEASGEVGAACAKCHSTPGYLDFLGVDGTAADVVDNPAPSGTTIECEACHNEVTVAMTNVLMPSGVELIGLGPEARCIQCHQGLHSTVSVDQSIADAGVTDDDEVSEDLGFSNIHYYAAAASQYGTSALGGYEYAGQTYDAKFDHVVGYDTCVDCHNSHTLELKIEECARCHSEVSSREDLENIRMAGSLVDYDGDGDTTEGIKGEIEGLQEILYAAMQAYAADVAGTPIAYDAASHPYFFDDAGEGYSAWTARLAKAAYNYQTSLKDPGSYAHGGKYIIQLLYDSIEDLDPVLVEGLTRIDRGHFAGSERPFRYFDDYGEVRAACAKCHSATGLPLFLKEGVNIAEPTANGLNCATCHSDLTTFALYEVENVEFPSGAMLDSGNPASNICLNCHQGQQSTASVNRAIARAGVGDDEVSEILASSSADPHYFAAGASLFGAEAAGAYQYEGKDYIGRFAHVPNFGTCTDCHSAHELEVEVEACGACHPGVESATDLHNIRIDSTDWDGDGDTEEGIAREVETMHDALYAAMQGYAADVAGMPIVADMFTYPYFFTDIDGDGEVDPDEAIFPNQYAAWTPRMLRAAYNYLWATKDPGSFAHNSKYILQTLYDALEDMGGDVSGMVRP